MFTSTFGLLSELAIPPSLEFTGRVVQATNSSSPIFSGVSFGATPTPTRHIVCCIGGYGPPNGVAASVTIGGISATIHTNIRMAAGTVLTIASANVPTGTSGTVQIFYPSTTSNGGAVCFAYAIDGMVSYAPTTYTDTVSPFSSTVSAAANSAVIFAGACFINNGGLNSWGGTAGIVEDDDWSAGVGAAAVGTCASLLTSTTLSSNTVTMTPATNNAAQMQGVIFT